jgi:hypothetical protein
MTGSLPSRSTKAAQSLVHGLVGLLEKPNLTFDNQVQLASLLIHLRSARREPVNTTRLKERRRVNSIALISDDLEASIARFCRSVEKFSALQKDLQVTIHTPCLVERS